MRMRKRLTISDLYEAYMFEQTIRIGDNRITCMEAAGTNHVYIVTVMFANGETLHEYVGLPIGFKYLVKRINEKLEELQNEETI